MRWESRLSRIMILLFGMAGSWAAATDARAQPSASDAKAAALQDNVVKITATFGEGGTQTGFGIIVGEQGRNLVVVTADHVVRGEDPGAEDKKPTITFFRTQGSQVQGKLETVRLPHGSGDLTVILVPRPAYATAVKAAIDPKPVIRGTNVWLVGRVGNWNIPASPGIVAQTNPFTGKIQVEGLAARAGSSGGPLISNDGIVGMIVDDGELYTEATPIAIIEKQVRDVWHYEWDLTASGAPVAISPPSGSTPPSRFAQKPIVTRTPGGPDLGKQPSSQDAATSSLRCDDAGTIVARLVCRDPGLTELDVSLAHVYQTKMGRLSSSDQRWLRGEESAWLKQRNDCASAVDMRGCVVQSYRTRIARLEGS
jgi:uncharacterized protein YecT (DUF1311 family)